MKKLTGFLFVSVTLSSFGQTLTPTVVAASGDFYSGSAANLSWTLGEIVTDTYIGTNNQLTQGFQQPEIRFSTLEDLAVEMTLSLFPNPSTGLVNFEVKNNTSILSILILDSSGKIIYTASYQPSTVHQIDLSSFARGIYFLQVNTLTNQKIKTIKIEKL